jgi:hypothetical protein
VFSEIPVLRDFSQATLAPEVVLERRLVKKGNSVVPHVCVKWQGLPDTATSWEDWYVLKVIFPDAAA